MNRTSISFPDEIYAKLQKQAKEKKISIAKHIRNLIDIGFRVEEMSSKSTHENDQQSIQEQLDSIKDLVKKIMVPGFESLYLTRYIVSNMPEKNTGINEKMLENSRIKAASFVEGLIENSQ